jgi:hypothetical protein
MGHYSEMYSDDRTPEQIKKDNKNQKRRNKIEKKICELFECKPNEMKVIYDILKQSRNIHN